MRLMSFALTIDQMHARTKCVTRRNGWKHAQPGDVVLAVEKARGVAVKDRRTLYPIRFTHVSEEALYEIGQGDVDAEGFAGMTTEEFIAMYCKANKCDRSQTVTVISFMEEK